MKKQNQQRRSKHASGVKRSDIPQTNRQRFSVPPRVLQTIAYCIIATAVVLSWFMTPVPVAAGFTILAAIRIGITVREVRREAADLVAADRCDKSGICSA